MRTLAGKELELIGEMKRYRLDVLGASEGKIRRNGMNFEFHVVKFVVVSGLPDIYIHLQCTSFKQ